MPPTIVSVPRAAAAAVAFTRQPAVVAVTRGPQGAPGQGQLGQVTYTDRTVDANDLLPPDMTEQLQFTPDPTLTENLLGPPFTDHNFWDGTKIVPRAQGDIYDIGLNLIVTKQVAGGTLTVGADVGSTLGPVAERTQNLSPSAGTQRIQIFPLRVVVREGFRDNGCILRLTSSVPATITSETLLVSPHRAA